jgi:hypothetical protein
MLDWRSYAPDRPVRHTRRSKHEATSGDNTFCGGPNGRMRLNKGTFTRVGPAGFRQTGAIPRGGGVHLAHERSDYC